MWNNLSIISTLIDAARAFTRGDRWAAAFLVGAAALSSRVPGVGTLASVLVRIVRYLR